MLTVTSAGKIEALLSNDILLVAERPFTVRFLAASEYTVVPNAPAAPAT